MKMINSDEFPDLNEIYYDLGAVGRGKLSICAGAKRKAEIKILKKLYGIPYVMYSDIHNQKLLAFEWIIKDGRKALRKLKSWKITD